MEALEMYFAQSANQVIRFFYYATGDFQAAIQLTIPSYVDVFRNLNKIEQLDRPSLYVYLKAQRVLRLLEKKDHKPFPSKESLPTIEIRVPEQVEYLFELQKILLNHLQRLPAQSRLLLVLCGIEEYKTELAARILGITKKRAALILQSALDAFIQMLLEQPDHASIFLSDAKDEHRDVHTNIDRDWVMQQLSMFPKFNLRNTDLEVLFFETKRIYQAAKKRRVTWFATICAALLLGVATLSIGEWKYSWVSHSSEQAMYAIYGTVPNLVPEHKLEKNNPKSEMVATDNLIHGGFGNEDAIRALQLVQEKALFKVYAIFNAVQSDAPVYLSDTQYNPKRQTLDLEYNFGPNTIHVWEAPSASIQDRYKNQGTLNTYLARPWHEKKNGQQTIYSTVFDGTMIALEAQTLADCEPILNALATPSNIGHFDGQGGDGQGGQWSVQCYYIKIEGLNEVNLTITIQNMKQGKLEGSNHVTYKLQGSSNDTIIHSDEYLDQNNLSSNTIITTEDDVPSPNSTLHVTINWQGHSQIIDLHHIPLTF